MDSIGTRLKAERKRLGLTQEGIVAGVSVTVQTQRRYEANQRVPDADYLQSVKKLGIDVNYVLFGEEENQNSDAAQNLVDAVVGLNENDRASLYGYLSALTGRLISQPDQEVKQTMEVNEKPAGYNQGIEAVPDKPINASIQQLSEIGQDWWAACADLSEDEMQQVLSKVFSPVVAHFIGTSLSNVKINHDGHGLEHLSNYVKNMTRNDRKAG